MLEMSEKTKFRIKVGDTEIEFEGSEEKALSLYEAAFKWASSEPPTSKATPDVVEKEKSKIIQKDPEEKRGGSRTSSISPVIDKLIEEGFMLHPNTRKLDDLIEELGNRGYPSKGTGIRRTVNSKLTRLRKKGTVKAIKDGNDWVFWTEA